MKLKDLMKFIIDNDLKEEDEILIRDDVNEYREPEMEIHNAKVKFIMNDGKFTYKFISL
ncbi:hypothetical protein J6W34_03275 [bacterium]|nr:hypothetical protein [bacterium]